ncbi:hypothetical protein FQZ97_1073860 [compost metagenome]
MNKTNTVNSSSRPSSIANVHTQIWNSLSTPKLLAGPTSPRPGPMLLTVATTAENEVTMSSPVNSSSMVRPMVAAP